MKRKNIIILIVCLLVAAGFVFAGVKTNLLQGSIVGRATSSKTSSFIQLVKCNTSVNCKQGEYCSTDGFCRVPCENISNCKQGEYCSTDGFCRIPLATCENSSNCKRGEYCSTGGFCVR